MKKRFCWEVCWCIAILLVSCHMDDLEQDALWSECLDGKCDNAEIREAQEKGLAGPRWTADWTLCVYAGNDVASTSLAHSFDRDVEEIKHGLGGSAKFRILVQRDYAEHQLDIAGQPRPTERFGLYREKRFHPQTLKLENAETGETGVELLGETNTADPAVLESFLSSCVRTFPAKRYWVIILGHGDSWNGLVSDDTSGWGQWLALSGLKQALMNTAKIIATEIRPKVKGNKPSNKIDVVQFDACHMGAIEVASAIKDAADYMVASQEVVPSEGHPYSALRSIAQDHTEREPKTVIKEVVIDFVRSYVEGISTLDYGYVGATISAVGLELGELNPLLEAMANLKAAILEERPEGFSCKEARVIKEASLKQADQVESHACEWSASTSNPPSTGADGAAPVCGRGSIAVSTAADLIAFLEVIAGPEKCRRREPSCAAALPELPDPLLNQVTLSDKVRESALRTLDIIAQPYISPKGINNCGSGLMFDNQYRQMVTFQPRLPETKVKSPFVIEAHKVDGGGRRATDISLLFGDPMGMHIPQNSENSPTPLAIYRALPFEQSTGWSQVLGKCIAQAKACYDWDGNQDSPDPCAEL